MSTATTPISKALSMAADSCLLSLPYLFTTKTQCPYPALPSKPVKLQLSCCHSSLFLSSFFLKKRTHFPSVVSFVAQTSDWAQQEEDNTLTIEQENLEMPTWENQESQEFKARVSDWGAEGDDATIKVSEDEGGSGEEEEPFVEPPEEAKLFVGNLPYDVDSQKLAMLLEQAGTVEISEVIFNRDTDQSRGFGFVTMSTVEEAEKAVEMFDRYDLDGRLLTVNKASPRGAKPEQAPRISEPAFRIYVGNLPWDVDNARLEQVFSKHGKVVDARVVYDRETGRSRGFGFVTMSTRTEVDDAIAALDGQTLEGRAIRVNVAEERSRRSSF